MGRAEVLREDVSSVLNLLLVDRGESDFSMVLNHTAVGGRRCYQLAL